MLTPSEELRSWARYYADALNAPNGLHNACVRILGIASDPYRPADLIMLVHAVWVRSDALGARDCRYGYDILLSDGSRRRASAREVILELCYPGTYEIDLVEEITLPGWGEPES